MKTGSPRSLQEWLHWFEIGDGARRLRAAALVIAALLLTWLVCHKQFRGPLTETTLAQAVVGRQLAQGDGFTTLVNYPQSFAWARERAASGKFTNTARPLPELHQPPLYPAAIGAALFVFRLLPQRIIAGADGAAAAADYALLALNIALLWCAALQTYFLAKKIFGASAGIIATCALLLSAPVWSATVALGGAPLTMVLLLALFQLMSAWIGAEIDAPATGSAGILPADSASRRPDRPDQPAGSRRSQSLARHLSPLSPIPPALAGLVTALLFLTDYSAIIIFPIMCAWLWLRAPAPARRLRAPLVFAAVFIIAVSPWLARNISLTDNPLAFASQNIALKAGDPTAEPATIRATFSTATPALDIHKLGNKALTSLQTGIGSHLWSGGGIFLTAFFIAGFLYRFRDARANRLRWLAAATLPALALAQAFLDSGEGERSAWTCAAPLIVIFGTGFFAVLVSSNETLAARPARAGLAALVLLAAQAAPLARNLAAPASRNALSYNFPPYLPTVFSGMAGEMARGRETPLAWMADVPAGAAWYSGQRVWAQPAALEDFARASAWQPVRALVLTPATLDRPAASLLKFNAAGAARPGWAGVYRAILAGNAAGAAPLPAGFPLTMPKRVLDNFHVLIDPLTPATGN